ncbi:Uncharacterised protein [Mycobacteroides abscessus subsp. abscessus]|nr:Uncharacterised protein [Mycobacteroides abscessus subsp. abscessus]
MDGPCRRHRAARPSRPGSPAGPCAHACRQRRHHLHGSAPRTRIRVRPRRARSSGAVAPGWAAPAAGSRRLECSGGRAHPAGHPAGCGSQRLIRSTGADQFRSAAAPAALRASRLCAGCSRHGPAGAAPAVSARLRYQPHRHRRLSCERGLDTGTVRCRLCDGGPAGGRPCRARSVREGGAAANFVFRADTAVGADRCRAGVRGGSDDRGAEPRHPFGDLFRSGLPRLGAGFPAGRVRRSGGTRRQAMDALARHPAPG